VVSRDHFELARRFRAIYSKYERGRDLVQIGAYAQGSDPALDEAINLHDGMSQFLQQDMYEAASIDSVLDEMDAATNLNLGIS
jgi:flagellum-specific ATP synthase